jgi:hypothetical protein
MPRPSLQLCEAGGRYHQTSRGCSAALEKLCDYRPAVFGDAESRRPIRESGSVERAVGWRLMKIFSSSATAGSGRR